MSNEVKLDSTVNYGKRVMELLDRWVPIMRKKVPARAIVLYRGSRGLGIGDRVDDCRRVP